MTKFAVFAFLLIASLSVSAMPDPSVSGLSESPSEFRVRSYYPSDSLIRSASEPESGILSHSVDGWTYSYSAQSYDGVPVFGTPSTRVFRGNRLVLLDQTRYPQVKPANMAKLSGSEALERVRQVFGLRGDEPELWLLPFESGKRTDFL
ncbi:MAG TPA: hypothetical protein VI874_03860, partial [Candidatus Norongarragalinales archaeon]|nr:hypothetical protein [Candidatus Norongarragalinales archaeon]